MEIICISHNNLIVFMYIKISPIYSECYAFHMTILLVHENINISFFIESYAFHMTIL